MNSSVKYSCLKYARINSHMDEQKARWASDACFPVAQYGGVVVNPCRGFSMGSGCGPGETFVANAAKAGLRSLGPTYQHQGPDLNIGMPSVSTRGPGADGSTRTVRARGGGLPGTTFRALSTGQRLLVPSSSDGRHHDPGTPLTRFTSTKVQILTQLRDQGPHTTCPTTLFPTLAAMNRRRGMPLYICSHATIYAYYFCFHTTLHAYRYACGLFCYYVCLFPLCMCAHTITCLFLFYATICVSSSYSSRMHVCRRRLLQQPLDYVSQKLRLY